MRRLVHLSDVHFGRVDPTVAEALVGLIWRMAPHLVVVSGDLTQRARGWQFRDAREFLDALPRPQVVVPGNHDVPLYNVAVRMLRPLGGYTRHITANLKPVHADEEMVVVGINTTRSFTISGGTIRPPDLRHACDAFGRAADAVKIVVAHHPFGRTDEESPPVRTPATLRALESLARCGADVFLTGHLHVSYTGHTASRYRIAGRMAIVVEAGTATSTRMRGEPNAFNVLDIDRALIVVERWQWSPTAALFEPVDRQGFERTDGGWEQRVESAT